MKNSLIVVGVFLLAMAAVAYFFVGGGAGKELSSSSVAKEPATAALPGSIEMSSSRPSTNAGAVEIATVADAYTEADYERFKSEYNCDLAKSTRENCEAVDRGPEANEQCLQMNQYYTYARHCGFQP